MNAFIVVLALIGYLGKCQGQDIVPPDALKVTLSVSSGVPNPQWLIDDKTVNYQKIKELYSSAKTSGATFLPEQMPAQLGYKGFLVQENGQDQASLIVGPKTIELQEELLKSCPTGVKGVPELFKQQLAVVIKGGKVLPVDLKEEGLIGGGIKRVAPNYEKATFKWNHGYAITRNNCYNYANDKVTNTFAQPGDGSGHPFAVVTGDEIREAARSDGLLRMDAGVGGGIPQVSPTGPWHLVALVVDPAWAGHGDFHWYRLDSNGRWSHKPGQTRITDRDGAGNQIADPRLAANVPGGPNYAFVCFMRTNKDTVKIE